MNNNLESLQLCVCVCVCSRVLLPYKKGHRELLTQKSEEGGECPPC